MAEDLSETRDLAAEHPERVAEMVELWWREAERNQVLPLDNRVLWVADQSRSPHRRRERTSFRYFPGGAQVPEPVAVNVRNRSHAMTVQVEVPEGASPPGSSWPSARPSAAGRSTSSTVACATSTTSTARARYVIEADDVVGARLPHAALHVREGRQAGAERGPS